jgi:hypothetical protein
LQRWSYQERTYLKSNYNIMTDAQLMEHFINRSWLSIYKEAFRMGLHRDKQIEFVDRSEARKGDKGANWKGGRQVTKDGYILIYVPDYPSSSKRGYVFEHIYVFEQATGIIVPPNCCIHHLNGNKSDNRIENLCLMGRGAHTMHHHIGSHRTAEARKNMSEARKKLYA